MPTSSHWTHEDVIALTQDRAAINAGRNLAGASHWRNLSFLESSGIVFIWGLCQGSGKIPYQVVVDWSALVYKCTCPSRKFPCKHVLALMLLYLDDRSAFIQSELEQWVALWVDHRLKPLKMPSVKRGTPSGAAAPEKRRNSQREKNAVDGIAALEIWLFDLVHQGLAAARSKPQNYWDSIAVRLVDFQMPGLARRVRELGALVANGGDWQEQTLHALGELYLVVSGYKRISKLPKELQAEIRSAVGHSIRRDELGRSPGVIDRWLILAGSLGEMYTGEVNRSQVLSLRRTWVFGVMTKKLGLLLEFTPGHIPFDRSYVPGTFYMGEAVFYPGVDPLRLFFRSISDCSEFKTEDPTEEAGFPIQDITSAWIDYAARYAKNPWSGPYLYFLNNVVPSITSTTQKQSAWIHEIENDRSMPVDPAFDKNWELIALSGGRPVDVLGEWDGRYFKPLRVLADKRWVNLV